MFSRRGFSWVKFSRVNFLWQVDIRTGPPVYGSENLRTFDRAERGTVPRQSALGCLGRHGSAVDRDQGMASLARISHRALGFAIQIQVAHQ